MTIAYVEWRDACTEDAQEPSTALSTQPLMDLCEVGFLLAEGDDYITLGMETVEDGGGAGRWRLHIPKVNIRKIKTIPVDNLLKWRPRKPKTSE